MTKDEALRLALEALGSNRRTHHYCEDTWYSCPKHEDGCANDSESDECNCGADKANAGIDQAITAIKQALATPVQDSTCNETLRAQGKAYPRTCRKCGLGPCIGAPKQPPAQPAPVQKRPQNCGTGYCSCIECVMEPEQEPVDYEKLAALGWQAIECGICGGGAMGYPQRTWVGLTDEEKAQFVVAYYPSNWDRKTAVALMSDYEKYLKEKNFD